MLTYALVGIGGAIAGFVVEAQVRSGRHRRAGETSLPKRFTAWISPVTTALTLAVWWALSPGSPIVVVLVYSTAVWVMVALAAIDLDVHRLPDAIQLPAYPLLLALLALASWSTEDWGAYVRALLAGIALFAAYFGLVIVAPAQGMGLGDAKLAGLLGMLLGWLGWLHVVAATLATFLVGGLVASHLLLVRRAGRRTSFAYGPSLLVGTAAAIVGLSGPALDLLGR